MNYQFYASFLNLSNIPKHEKELSQPSYRQFLIGKVGKTIPLIKTLAPSLQKTVIKPQRLHRDDVNYYIATDMMTNTYYICYRTLLMIDIDYYKHEKQRSKDELLTMIDNYCDQHKDYRFFIYSTRNGLHVFLVSHHMDYKSVQALQIMIDLDCDFYYVVYSYIRGWSVRLNKKKNEEDDQLYHFITDLGHGKIDPLLLKLVNLHINLVGVFKDVRPNLMYGG